MISQGKDEASATVVKTTDEKKAELKAVISKLDRTERTTGQSGAVPLTPKRMLLDASDVAKREPEKRLRWVNVGTQEKALSRQADGYERLPVAEGGRQVGNLALFALPRQEYERRVAAIEKLGKERLEAYKAEFDQVAESVAKTLRDRHGLKVNAEDIIITKE